MSFLSFLLSCCLMLPPAKVEEYSGYYYASKYDDIHVGNTVTRERNWTYDYLLELKADSFHMAASKVRDVKEWGAARHQCFNFDDTTKYHQMAGVWEMSGNKCLFHFNDGSTVTGILTREKVVDDHTQTTIEIPILGETLVNFMR